MNSGGALERAAVAWAQAHTRLAGADTGAWLAAACALDAATHDLLIAAGERCPYCEPGTCPGAILERSDGRDHEQRALFAPIIDTPPL